jgi:glucose/arabinose dehydrogenase
MTRLLLSASALALGLATGVAAAPGGRAPAFARLIGVPDTAVYVTSAPDDPATLYVVGQAGRIDVVRNRSVVGTLLDIRSSVESDGEHGLLSVAFHPQYAQNHLFYVDYTDLAGDTRIVEYRAENGVAVPSSARELLHVPQPYPNHKGGQLAFDRAGRLYVGMGDGGTNPAGGPTSVGDPENRAQDPESKLGKLLRIDPTAPGSTWQAVAYGLRNPWRFSFDRQTGDLWLGDVGAARNEEVDLVRSAQLETLLNFGWSRYEGKLSYNQRVALGPGTLVTPFFAYGHSTSLCGVIGGYRYRGTRVPALRGRYVFGDLCSGDVWTLTVGAHPKRARLGPPVAGLSSFGEDASGELYATSLKGYAYVLR